MAPPYDVIDPALQDRLYEASPYNVIRLELNRDEPGDTRRRRPLHAGGPVSQGLAARGHPPRGRSPRALRLPPDVRSRREDAHPQGVPGAGAAGAVRPGEDLPPRTDPRRAPRPTGWPSITRPASTSARSSASIPTPTDDVQRTIEAGLRDRTPLVATDHLGVENRLWVVTDQETHTAVSGLMAAKPVFIADGHHRYETGLKYRDELAASGQSSGHDDPSQLLPDDARGHERSGAADSAHAPAGIGLSRTDRRELAARLEPRIRGASRPARAKPAAARPGTPSRQSGEQDLLGFGTVADGQWLLARLRSDAAMDRLAPDQSADWRSLGVSVLHVLVLKELLGDLGKPSCRYVHSIREVLTDVAARGCDLACLVPPAQMNHVESIASNLETMPPKSTYFYPKLLTGLVLNPIRRLD